MSVNQSFVNKFCLFIDEDKSKTGDTQNQNNCIPLFRK